MAELFPELVVFNHDGSIESVKYDQLAVLLTYAFQEWYGDHKILEAKHEKLDENYGQLKEEVAQQKEEISLLKGMLAQVLDRLDTNRSLDKVLNQLTPEEVFDLHGALGQ